MQACYTTLKRKFLARSYDSVIAPFLYHTSLRRCCQDGKFSLFCFFANPARMPRKRYEISSTDGWGHHSWMWGAEIVREIPSWRHQARKSRGTWSAIEGWEIAEDLNGDHATVAWHLKDIGKENNSISGCCTSWPNVGNFVVSKSVRLFIAQLRRPFSVTHCLRDEK